jgi:bifunctional DNase/RNase
MVEMHLAAVRVELPTNNPVVLLQEVEGARRTLPIFIGAPEATAIAFALQGVVTARPMTHDLFRDVLTTLGVDLDRVLITELRDGTYFAELHLSQGERRYTISSRPSDAIALAARLNAKIYADDELIDAEGVLLAPDEDDEVEDEDANPDEIVREFRSFIEGVRPEDFSS